LRTCRTTYATPSPTPIPLELIARFLASKFSGAERHQRRLDKVLALEAAFGAPEGD